MNRDFGIKKLKIKGLMNTRDLGGIPTLDGKKIKKGVLIRSGRLSKLSKKSVAALEKLNIRTVIDLRSDIERAEYPNVILNNCNYVDIPLLCTSAVGITREDNMKKVFREEGKRIKKQYGNVDNYMMNMYRENVMLPQTQEMLGKFFRVLLESEGCTLWCCTAGKDRTGICAMLLEAVLGVGRDVIIRDYTISYKFQIWKRTFQKIGLWILPIAPSFRSILIATMNAKVKYIMTAINVIEESYGDVLNYCHQALHLSDDDIAALRAKYLE